MIKCVEGTFDMLPDQAKFWQIFQAKVQKIFGHYGYREIQTPIFEQTNLFVRGIGEATDVVSKEMYKAISGGNMEKLLNGQQLKSKANLSLRPEGTAGVVRAVIQHGLVSQGSAPAKLLYMGPMFRAERPQAGRQRQFTQVGVECIGAEAPSVDAEAMIMLMRFYKEIGFDVKKNIKLVINSMGCKDCRPKYREVLKQFLDEHADSLCETCQTRKDINPLRTLDCKCESCQEILKDAPKISDYLCDDCKEHFDSVKTYLNFAGIDFELDWKLVRGLDYYTRTVFEVVSQNVGSQNAIAGGGRYDGLMKELEGQDSPGFGFALGYERTLLALQALGLEFEPAKTCDYFVACVDKADTAKAFEITQMLRDFGVDAEMDHQNRSLKSQFKLSDKLFAKHTVILGPDELKAGQVTVRNMETHEQDIVDIDKLCAFVNGKLQ